MLAHLPAARTSPSGEQLRRAQSSALPVGAPSTLLAPCHCESQGAKGVWWAAATLHPGSVPHTKSLEGRIKEELVAQGLLESEDRPAEDSEDEVLAELRKRQAELKALSAHNRTKKHELLR